MEELLELKDLIAKHDYQSALTLVEEMEEMSREDKINKVRSFVKILLIHLIKQDAENRTTRSWDLSIRNSLDGIMTTNKRHKSGGFYIQEDELRETIESVYDISLEAAALEAFGGSFQMEQLAEKFDANAVKKKAIQLILEAQKH